MKKINSLSLLLTVTVMVLLTLACEKTEETLDNCANIECQNGGTCFDGTCDCPNGFFGINCEIEDLCFGVTCENGGVCFDGNCNCPVGFIGANCENFDPGRVQFLLNAGNSPKELYEGNVPLDSLYGKMYEGGLIFYLNEAIGEVMIAALTDQGNPSWACNGLDIMGLNNVSSSSTEPETEEGARIGDGYTNTNKILQECTQNSAAKLCRELGFDWFLPSRSELNLMYINLHTKGHGDLSDYYWSSTEYDNEKAWRQDFVNGDQNPMFKVNFSNLISVRAVRIFNN